MNITIKLNWEKNALFNKVYSGSQKRFLISTHCFSHSENHELAINKYLYMGSLVEHYFQKGRISGRLHTKVENRCVITSRYMAIAYNNLP